MKCTLVFLAIIATAYSALSYSEYLPPLEDASSSNNIDLQVLDESSPLADNGYRYKIIKRLRLRHRRDINELPAIQSEPAVADIPVYVDVPVELQKDSAVLADDGYRYKTVKRIRYRHRFII